MTLAGIVIACGAAVAFLVVGALVLFGGTEATWQQLLPGYLRDRPALFERVATLVSLWLPAALIALLCLLAGIRILQVAAAALW